MGHVPATGLCPSLWPCPIASEGGRRKGCYFLALAITVTSRKVPQQRTGVALDSGGLMGLGVDRTGAFSSLEQSAGTLALGPGWHALPCLLGLYLGSRSPRLHFTDIHILVAMAMGEEHLMGRGRGSLSLILCLALCQLSPRPQNLRPLGVPRDL